LENTGALLLRGHGEFDSVISIQYCRRRVQPSAIAAWRMFYYQRCDTDLPGKYAASGRTSRIITAPHQATEARVYKWNGHPWYEAVGNEIADPTPHDVTGGWWDAGDFDKYMVSESVCHSNLLFGQQLFAFQPGDGTLNLPESGNGSRTAWTKRVGERISFCEWPTAPARRGVRCMSTRRRRRRRTPIRADDIADGEATIARMFGAGVCGGNWKQSNLDPAFADKCQKEAIKAWELLRDKPYPWVPDRKRRDEGKVCRRHVPERAEQFMTLAEACLFTLTGERQYEAKARMELSHVELKPGEGFDWYPAIDVYIRNPGADPQLVKELKKK